MKFDLFKLHDRNLDLSNESWICFYGPNLPSIIDDIKNDLMKKLHLKFLSELAKITAEKLNCRAWTPEQVLYGHKKWIPIPILESLIEMTDNPFKYKKSILGSITMIKCNSATSSPLLAIKKLDVTLCKIAGAHAGDGNLYSALGIELKDLKYKNQILQILRKHNNNIKIYKTQGRVRISLKNQLPKKVLKILQKFSKRKVLTLWLKYGINVTEMYEDNIRAYAEWIKDVFGINIKVSPHGTKNAWRADFDNKIIARYFMQFFGFPAGAKTYTVKEPDIIKNSVIKFRKAFLLGLMTFEGYTPYTGRAIGFSSKSKKLTESVYDIVIKLKIPLKEVKKDNYGRFVCVTNVLNKINLKKALHLFENNTEKWFRIENALSNFQ